MATDSMTVTEAARELGVTRQRVLRLIELGRLAGELTATRTAPIWLVSRASVDLYGNTPRKRAGRPKSAPIDNLSALLGENSSTN